MPIACSSGLSYLETAATEHGGDGQPACDCVRADQGQRTTNESVCVGAEQQRATRAEGHRSARCAHGADLGMGMVTAVHIGDAGDEECVSTADGKVYCRDNFFRGVCGVLDR